MFREQLILRALAALSEIADECGKEPARKTLSLRFLLAYTFAAAGARPDVKWLWAKFWTSATRRNSADPMDDYIRGTGARSALNGICREVGYPPEVDFLAMLRGHRKVRQRAKADAETPWHANDEPRDDNAA